MYNQNERVEVVERNKDGPLPVPAVLWIVSPVKKNPDSKKQIKIRFD